MCVANIRALHIFIGSVGSSTTAPGAVMNEPLDPNDLLPLRPIAFDVLLSLLDGEAHGYAIMRSVDDRTTGANSLHAGTLYRALSRLVDTGLIQEVERADDGTSDERRRYYGVTSLGRRVAAAEARRLESQLGAARAHGLLESA